MIASRLGETTSSAAMGLPEARALSGAAGVADEAFFDRLHSDEFRYLHGREEIYLDYAGAALYGESQLRAHDQLLRGRLFGNPHSEHAPSRAATETIAAARERLLALLGVSPESHAVVFTANASAAIRLVAESFPFSSARGFVFAEDNHNSVNGVAEFARRAGAPVHLLPLGDDLALEAPEERLRTIGGGHLLAFPAQSNFSGVRHPLRLAGVARELGLATLLDAAAFVPTAKLDLAAAPVDFVALSFYKMFGFPTGVGALVARRDALARLDRPWFAGGTVLFAAPASGRHRLRPGADGFEDGTPNFLGIAALDSGFDFLEKIGQPRLARRVAALTAAFLDGAESLRHPDGQPKVRIHGPLRGGEGERGGIVAFNVLDRRGRIVSFPRVEAAARSAAVCLRGGCFCNPGAAAAALGLDREAVERCATELGAGFSPESQEACVGTAVGAVRVSFGAATRASDLERALGLISAVAASADGAVAS